MTNWQELSIGGSKKAAPPNEGAKQKGQEMFGLEPTPYKTKKPGT